MATEKQREKFAKIMSQGADDAAKSRQAIAEKVANFKPAGALSGIGYHASTERLGGKRRRRRSRRKSRRKSRKSRRKRRKSRKKRKRSRRRRRRR